MENDGVSLLPEELRSRLEELKLDALAEFAAGAGHEINNPLAIISGHAQILLRKTEDSETRHHLAVILAQTKRAYEMIADIRLFARPPLPQIRSVELGGLIEKFLSKMNEDYGGAGVRYRRLLPLNGDDLTFCSDAAQLMTIFVALGKNAAEAMPDGGEVLVSFELSDEENSENKTVQLIMEDNGPGIPEEIRDQIFSPYFSGRQSGRGLGFGLSKAWQLMKGLGGSIRLVPSVEFQTGCRWQLTLPLE